MAPKPRTRRVVKVDTFLIGEISKASDANALHEVVHYLYFPTHELAMAVKNKLIAEDVFAEERSAPNGSDWAVIVCQKVVPTEHAIAAARDRMGNLANEFNGEYDGWEAKVGVPLPN